MIDRPVRYKAWNSRTSPRRILLIRLQAIGDVMITFPFVQQLKNQYPSARFIFLTRAAQVEVVRRLYAVDEVIAFTDAQHRGGQLLSVVKLLAKLVWNRFDVILDLQMTSYTVLLRQLLVPRAFAEFERFTAYTAADRYEQAIKASGLFERFEHPLLRFNETDRPAFLLRQKGWDGQKKLLILNPAGAFPSRNWPIENYKELARLWLSKYTDYQIVVVGTAKLIEKAAWLETELGEALINLTGQTTLVEAFAIVAKADLMVSEDSGLLHMAWALKKPTVALIGSTDKNRSAQNGSHMVILHSDDLPCGNCMKAACQFGEIPICLSRYSPDQIVRIAERLVMSL